MRILHIVGRSLEEGNGIITSVPSLVSAQNRIVGVEASQWSPDSKNNMLSDFSSYLELYRPTIVVFQEVYYTSYLKMYKLLKKRNIPYLITPRCSLTQAAQKQRYVTKRIVNFLFFNQFLRSAAAICYLNEGECAASVHQHTDKLIINNGIERARAEIERKRKETVTIVYLSRIDFYHKGLDLLMDAVRCIPEAVFVEKNFTLAIYGGGAQKDVTRLEEELKAVKHPFVSYHGAVYGERKSDLLQTGNIFILTSRFEGMPIAVLEAISNGMPCIVTPGTNMAEDIAEHGVGWVVDPDPQKIAATIVQAVDEYREQLSVYVQRCVTIANQKYDWDRIAEHSITQYKTVISSSHRLSP